MIGRGEAMRKREHTGPGGASRRSFLSTLLLGTSLAASYGLAAVYAVRFLHPGRRKKRLARMFVTFTSRLPAGGSMTFETPAGERFLLTHTGKGENPYRAFSSLCPHLALGERYGALLMLSIPPANMVS